MLNYFRDLFRRNPLKFIFWPLLVGAFITGGIQVHQQSILSNEEAPHGIVSLELGKTFSDDKDIMESWDTPIVSNRETDSLLTSSSNVDSLAVGINKTKILAVAHRNVQIDNWFIVFYTGLAIVIVCLFRRNRGRFFTGVLVVLAVTMAVADWTENYFMLRFINKAIDGTLWRMSAGLTPSRVPAIIKMVIIGILLLYFTYELIVRKDELMQLSRFVSTRWRQVYRYRVIFIGLGFFVLSIWFLAQGQDLVINTNATPLGLIVFIGVLVLVALVNWYLAKLFFRVDAKAPIYPATAPVLAPGRLAKEKKVSRFLGVLTILGPSMAMLNGLKVARIHYLLDVFPPGLTLIFWLSVFYLLIKYEVVHRLLDKLPVGYHRSVWLGSIGLLGLVGPLIVLACVHSRIREPQSLYEVHVDLLLVALAFLIFISEREIILPAKNWLNGGIAYTVLAVALTLSAFFLLVNISPQFFNDGHIFGERFFATLPLLLCGIAFYSLGFTLLIRLSRKLKVNFVLLIFIVGVIIATTRSNDYHLVELDAQRADTVSGMELGDYFKEWLHHRRAEIKAAESYPVFLVNTYGGGIKASAFTSMVLTYLDSASIAQNEQGFEHYTFSISGASGGTTGAAVHCAYWQKNCKDKMAYNMDRVDAFYRHDFLTPVLLTNVGRDVLASATSFHFWDDRSGVQEENWAEIARDELGLNLWQSYSNLWRTGDSSSGYEVPLLFANTLNVDDGLKGICAPVKLRPVDFPATVFIQDIVHKIDSLGSPRDSADISLITGAFLSARFPFLSPGGKLGPRYHFIDGGGKDNSGASTSECIFLRLLQYMADNPTDPDADLYPKLRFHFISISHSIRKKEDPRLLVDNHLELASPLVGIVNSGIDGNARAADSTLNVRYQNKSFNNGAIHTDYLPVYPVAKAIPAKNGGRYSPVLPLGWQISAPALQLLRMSFAPGYRDSNISTVVRLLPGHTTLLTQTPPPKQ